MGVRSKKRAVVARGARHARLALLALHPVFALATTALGLPLSEARLSLSREWTGLAPNVPGWACTGYCIGEHSQCISTTNETSCKLLTAVGVCRSWAASSVGCATGAAPSPPPSQAPFVASLAAHQGLLYPGRALSEVTCSPGVDLMIVLDRSRYAPSDCQLSVAVLTDCTSSPLTCLAGLGSRMLSCRSIRGDDWKTQVMPFVSSVSQSFMNGASSASIRRIGVVVFPGDGNNNQAGDHSGPAQTRVQLSTTTLSTILSYTSDGAKDCSDRKVRRQQARIHHLAPCVICSCYEGLAGERAVIRFFGLCSLFLPSTPSLCLRAHSRTRHPPARAWQAASTLRFPCSGWTYTSMWTALDLAKQELFDNSPSAYSNYKKVVLLVTDGAPERNNDMGASMKRARPTYLTLAAAQVLKDLGALVMGVGYSRHFSKGFDDCYPLCQGAQAPFAHTKWQDSREDLESGVATPGPLGLARFG